MTKSTNVLHRLEDNKEQTMQYKHMLKDKYKQALENKEQNSAIIKTDICRKKGTN